MNQGLITIFLARAYRKVSRNNPRAVLATGAKHFPCHPVQVPPKAALTCASLGIRFQMIVVDI